jgi:hypothetical protein
MLLLITPKRGPRAAGTNGTQCVCLVALRDLISSGRTGCEALAYGSRGLSCSRGLKSKPRRKGGVLVYLRCKPAIVMLPAALRDRRQLGNAAPSDLGQRRLPNGAHHRLASVKQEGLRAGRGRRSVRLHGAVHRVAGNGGDERHAVALERPVYRQRGRAC